MSIISLPNIYSNGEVIDAGQLNSNLSTIVNDYNGNITNANLSSSIAITDSKLNQIQTAGKVNGSALTSLANIPSGAGVIPAANLTYINVQYPYVKISDTRSTGTTGGSASTGSWTNRVLNTTDTDTQSISSLGSNQVTLPAGTYITKIAAVFSQTGYSQIMLYNATGSVALLTGMSHYYLPASAMCFPAILGGLFTLSTSSALEVQYYVKTSSGTGDLGIANTITSEVYTIAEFWKIQ